jgi:myo-inositol-1(or 4)-monophosphatase
MSDNNPILNIAIRAARKAGHYIAQSLTQFHKIRMREKTPNDWVTSVDETAQKIILETILQSYPGHQVIAEEEITVQIERTPDIRAPNIRAAQAHKPSYAPRSYTSPESNSITEATWIIDPLDGTANFVHQIPHYAISIAIQQNEQIEFGVIYNPISQELFTATRGGGARLNEHRIRVSETATINQAIIATGFPHLNKESELPNFLKQFVNVFQSCSDIRRTGSSVLDLAYVACGRFDGYWEDYRQPWDLAAGLLLVQEAGGLVSNFKGQSPELLSVPKFLKAGQILAGNPKIHLALKNLI